MVKYFTACCACFLFVFFAAAASPADSTVTITSSTNSYEFVYNKKAERVEVKQILNSVYASNTVFNKFPVVELYNNNVTIDDVTAKVDNHSVHDFKPEYSYYSANDVFFSDEKICYFPLLLPKKGSTGNVTFNETVNDPRYFTTVFFSDESAVVQREIVIKVPRWMNVELKEMNFGAHRIIKSTVYDGKNDADIITYSVQGLPAMKREENSPGPTYIYPHLLILCKSASVGNHDFKYFASLDDQYGWYRGLAKSINNNHEIISAKAKELTAGPGTDMDKIKAIFYYVQENIRYVAFEDGMAGFKPEKADEVLRKKYGDCKGMANLTKELLSTAGFDARLCWLGTDHIAYDYQTPSLAVDNHMICGLIYKGKTIYLDATEKYIGINEYAQRIQGRQVLMENGDYYLLNRIPETPAEQNSENETSTVAIDGANLTGTVACVWRGQDREYLLSGLNSIKREKADEAMMGFLSNQNSDYEIKGLKLSGADSPGNDLTASYTFTYKNAVSLFSKAYYLDLDFKKELLNSAIKIGERKYDYWFDYKMDINKETELKIPANYKVAALPPALNIVNADYEFHIQYQNIPGKLIYKKRLLIRNPRLQTSKFAQWNRDIEQLAKTYNETVTLKPLTE